ncbi:hypothetical protein EBZ39_08060 [bacterium]|nr:hypothetical protein [bacterium]
MSNSVVTTSKMELSPMRVSYGPLGNEVDLGGTLANVVISTKYAKSNILADQSGSTVRDRRTSGLEITVTTELVEIQNKDIWKVVFPHATKIGTGQGSLAVIQFEGIIGDGDQINSNRLILHPLSKSDIDLSTDYTFFKATASAESSITYGPSEQARLKIVWNILPDETQVPNKFFRYGDPAIVAVPAVAGSPVFTGTGNGTLTGVVVSNQFTATETITVLCLGAPGANLSNWSVTGSVSGPLGIVQVTGGPGGTGTFSANQIGFVITDGSTDFVAGDQFTIATTAAS